MATEPLGDCNLKDEFPPPPKNTWVEHMQQVGLHGIFTGGIRKQGPIELVTIDPAEDGPSH